MVTHTILKLILIIYCLFALLAACRYYLSIVRIDVWNAASLVFTERALAVVSVLDDLPHGTEYTGSTTT